MEVYSPSASGWTSTQPRKQGEERFSFLFVCNSHLAILMSLQPNAVSIFAMVCTVKLCLPVIHLDISDSLLWSFWAKSFWVRFFWTLVLSSHNEALSSSVFYAICLCREIVLRKSDDLMMIFYDFFWRYRIFQ